MSYQGRVVKTYGRLQQKTVKKDNWISPDALPRRKATSVFSSPENDSYATLDSNVVEVPEKENIAPDDVREKKKPQRKAAKKAKAALEEHVHNVNSEGDAKKDSKTKQKTIAKSRQFTKLSRKYKKLTENESILEEDEEEDEAENGANKKRGKKLGKDAGKTASKPSDLSFDLVYNLTKKKKSSGKSSSSDDCNVSPIAHDGEVECLTFDDAIETSTPCEAKQHSLHVGKSFETKGHITRRRAKRDAAFSPEKRCRKRPKRQCVSKYPVLNFSEDESFTSMTKEERTRYRGNVSDIVSCLSDIHIRDDSDNECEGDDEESRTRECSVRLDKLTIDSVNEQANGSACLFTEDEEDDDDDVLIKANIKRLSCEVSLKKLSVSSRGSSDEHDSGTMELPPACGDKRPLIGRRKEKGSPEEMVFRTPVVNKSISRLALDSFKVALTPTRSKKTGKLLSPKQKVLAQCEQEDFLSFSKFQSPSMMKKCVKIGEGVYGEVFRTSNTKKVSVALKIIPVEGDFQVNEENQKTFEEILPEIVISRELSMLRAEGDGNRTTNYIQVNQVACVQGSYPKKLLDEWDKFDRKKTSENDRPDMFSDDQIFIVFEFADGGKDLESFEFENVLQAVSVLQQVTGALAAAERELEFEHRDLHWGNVLVRKTREDRVTFLLDGEEVTVRSNGLHVSIIDFTLSRLQKDECTVFCDLAEDPTLFTGEGDKQFDVYRSMKDHNNNEWESFRPKTNVFWLEYLMDKVIWEKKYPTDRSQRKVLAQLKALMRELDQYSSAEDILRNSQLLSI